MWEYLGRVGTALIVAGLVLTFGFVGFGPVLILLGVLLILIRRARVLLPSRVMSLLIGGLAGLIVWYCLLPLACTTTQGGDLASNLESLVRLRSHTTCSTVFGLTSPGGGWALVIGCVIGLGVGVLTAHVAQLHGVRDRALSRK